jgi:hypothetical protein
MDRTPRVGHRGRLSHVRRFEYPQNVRWPIPYTLADTGLDPAKRS